MVKAKSDLSVPNHLAIIPDANRRWARERGLPPWQGHEAGAKNLKVILRAARRMGIKHISFWGSSLDNLQKRPFQEKKALLGIYKKYFAEMLESQEIIKNKIKIRVIGKWKEQFPSPLVRLIEKCLRFTEKFGNYNLNLLLAYNGDEEMISAFRKISRDRIPPSKINGELIKSYLETRELPPVDFLIRTGGEPHLSAGFMMWDIINSQLYFTKTKWPDFSEEELKKAVEEFGERERRFGR